MLSRYYGAALCLLVSSFSYALEEKQDAYSLANSCFSIQNEQSSKFIGKSERGKYGFYEDRRSYFYLKPSALGRYLLYDEDGVFFSRTLLTLDAKEEASPSSEWRIRELSESGLYSLENLESKLRLRHLPAMPALARVSPKNEGRREVHDRQSFRFHREDMESCAEFPEVALDAEVDPEYFSPKDPEKPIYGFADLHTHIAFPKAMNSFAMHGGVFHPYGMKHALSDCRETHGKDGSLNLLELQYAKKGSSGYNTSGYPDFTYWPNRKSHTHIQTYYKWMERTYLSGLRVLVTHATGNPSFCQLLSLMKLKNPEGKCTGIDAVEAQTQYMYKFQDYIDAQEGGPGKGWLRIVTSPQEARQVIADNKLAVILGAEHSTLFNCSGSTECSEAHIEEQLDRLHAMGVRSVFPIHRFDNAFGGARLQEGLGGAWMHLTSKMSTSEIETITDLVRPDKLLRKDLEGYYHDVVECPEGVKGVSSIKSMKEFMEKDFASATETFRRIPVVGGVVGNTLDKVFLEKLEPLPEYENFQKGVPACNSRTLKPKGRYLIEGLMKRGMIIEVDHMSYPTFQAVMDILEDAQYSGVISSHDWFENNLEHRNRIHSLGGIITPFPKRPSESMNDILARDKEMKRFKQFSSGMAIGTDVQGVAAQAWGDEGFQPDYPFTSADGYVRFLKPKTGNREFDFAKEGVAHYGLMAEWVHNLAIADQESDEKFFHMFMNSAETYIQMWERAQAFEKGH